MAITFCEPNVAIVGASYNDLKDKNIVIGKVSFEDQGRSRIMRKNKGLMHVYADAESGQLLGAELIAPHGEHLAHLLAWVIQQKLNVFQVLQFPFYHPVVEEGLRTALRDLAKQVGKTSAPFDLALCESEAIDSLN